MFTLQNYLIITIVILVLFNFHLVSKLVNIEEECKKCLKSGLASYKPHQEKRRFAEKILKMINKNYNK